MELKKSFLGGTASDDFCFISYLFVYGLMFVAFVLECCSMRGTQASLCFRVVCFFLGFHGVVFLDYHLWS